MGWEQSRGASTASSQTQGGSSKYRRPQHPLCALLTGQGLLVWRSVRLHLRLSLQHAARSKWNKRTSAMRAAAGSRRSLQPMPVREEYKEGQREPMPAPDGGRRLHCEGVSV